MSICQRCTAKIQPELISVPGSKPVTYSKGTGTLAHLKERICQHVDVSSGSPCLLRQLNQYNSVKASSGSIF